MEFEIENTAMNQTVSQVVTKQNEGFYRNKDRARELLIKEKKGLFNKPRTASLGRREKGEGKGIYHADCLFFL